MSRPPLPTGDRHVAALVRALGGLGPELDTLDLWGRSLAARLSAGGRLLAVGNGGSAAQAQHLTAELVGRLRDDRAPLSAICLHADASSLTAIVNDYGVEEMYARQVRAHGRRGDVLVALSTSGRSPNVLSAVRAAASTGLTTWALTGAPPNALADLCDEAVQVEAVETATVQEVHLVAVHLLCAALDVALGVAPATESAPDPTEQRAAAVVCR